MKIEDAVSYWLGEIEKEHARAIAKFPPFKSKHEGYAIIKEEVDELWQGIKGNHVQYPDDDDVTREALQTATMALRFLVDLCVPISDPKAVSSG